MLRISEVYEKQVKVAKERPDGSEYLNFQKIYTTRDCLINPSYIVAVQPYEYASQLAEEKIKSTFPEGTKFSLLILDGNSFRSSEMIVVGSFDKLSSMLAKP